MVRHRNVFLAHFILLACMMDAPSTAQTFDKRTLFTFPSPVAMPGVTLPAGQYLFRLANPSKGPYVVQVVSADGTKPYGMFFSRRAERVEPAWMPEVRFIETPTDIPAAIRTWWYPGERGGYEFVYPKDQARRIAQAASQPVLTTQTETTTTEQTHTTDLTRVSSVGEEATVSASATPAASTPLGTSLAGVLAPWILSIVDPAIPTGGESVTNATRQPVDQNRFTWQAQVLMYDGERKTVTLKAPYLEHINRYISEFKRGDTVLLNWRTSGPGETDAIRYVGRYEAREGGQWGYILPVEFVSADTAGRLLTFSVRVPADALKTLKAVPSEGWIKVTTPFAQPNDRAVIDAVHVSAEPERVGS